MFVRMDAEAPVFWSSNVKSQLTGKVADAGKDWGQKKRVSEDDTAGQHQQCNEYERGQTSGDLEGQEVLTCCRPWGRKESDTTGQLNSNINIYVF